jgi:hypothetical protein
VNGKRNGFGDKHRPGGGPQRGKDSWTAKLCANSSLAQAFLSNTKQVIATLQANGSYTQALQKRSAQIAYLQNSGNGALLVSNCTQFFVGLNAARQTDQQAGQQQQRLEKNVDFLLQRAVPIVAGGYRDSSEE